MKKTIDCKKQFPLSGKSPITCSIILCFFLMICFSSVYASSSSQDEPDTKPAAPAGIESKSTIKPAIYVTDYYLDPGQITKQSVIKRNGLIKKRLENLTPDDDPAVKAQKLLAALSDSIVSELTAAGIKAKRIDNPDGLRKDFMPENLDLPHEGWLVAGWFTKVDEGNRAVSSTIGFGKGAESIEIETVVYDLSKSTREPFLHIGSDSAEKLAPGGILTKNPYSMAASYCLSKGATEKDVKKQGASIAQSIIKYMNDPEMKK